MVRRFHENYTGDRFKLQWSKHISQQRDICLHDLHCQDKPRQQWENKRTLVMWKYYSFYLRGKLSGDSGVVLLRCKYKKREWILYDWIFGWCGAKFAKSVVTDLQCIYCRPVGSSHMKWVLYNQSTRAWAWMYSVLKRIWSPLCWLELNRVNTRCFSSTKKGAEIDTQVELDCNGFKRKVRAELFVLYSVWSLEGGKNTAKNIWWNILLWFNLAVCEEQNVK